MPPIKIQQQPESYRPENAADAMCPNCANRNKSTYYVTEPPFMLVCESCGKAWQDIVVIELNAVEQTRDVKLWRQEIDYGMAIDDLAKRWEFEQDSE